MSKKNRKNKNQSKEKKSKSTPPSTSNKSTVKKQPKNPVIKETSTKTSKPTLFSWDVILVTALILFVLMTRVKLLGIPFERDEGGFAFTAFQILEGKELYSEIYDIKLPFLYALYSFFILVFGNSVEGIHFGLLVFDISYIILLFLFTRRFFDKKIAVISTLAFAILSLGPNLLGFATHATHLAILPGLGGLYLLMHAIETNNKKFFLLAGLSCGFAFLVKQQAVHFMLFSGFYVIFEFARRENKDWKEWFLSEAMLVAGSVTPYILVVIYMMLNGRFDDFWFYTFTWPSEYATSAETSASYEIFKMQFGRVIGGQEWLWYLALAGAISMFIVKIENKWRVFTLLLALFMAFGLATGFHFYAHYFIVFIPVVALLNGMFVRNVGEFINNTANVKWGLVVPLAIFIFAWSQIIRGNPDYFFNPDHEKILRECYGGNPFPESKVLGEFIKERTNPEDEIIIACSEPQIGFYAQRKSVNGQIFTYTLVDNGKYMKELQDEFINDIETKKPKISIYTWMGTSWLNKDTTGRVFKFIEQNHNKNYNLIAVGEYVPTRATQDGPIIYQTAYKFNNEALPYFNQRMQQWQSQNTQLQAQGRPGNPPPGLITVWERRPEAPSSVPQQAPN